MNSKIWDITKNDAGDFIWSKKDYKTEDDIILMGEALVAKLDSDILVTRGEKGMSLFMKDGKLEIVRSVVIDASSMKSTIDRCTCSCHIKRH